MIHAVHPLSTIPLCHLVYAPILHTNSPVSSPYISLQISWENFEKLMIKAFLLWWSCHSHNLFIIPLTCKNCKKKNVSFLLSWTQTKQLSCKWNKELAPVSMLSWECKTISFLGTQRQKKLEKMGEKILSCKLQEIFTIFSKILVFKFQSFYTSSL